MRRLFARDDSGVSEVVGYILTFALSAIILLISVQSFTLARSNSDSVIMAVELKSLATRVSSRVIEAGLVSHEFPDATYSVTIQIPKDLHGVPYYIEAYQGVSGNPSAIYAISYDQSIVTSASILRLEETGLQIEGRVESSEEHVVITYTANTGKITISG